jgi:cell division protease FtsH
VLDPALLRPGRFDRHVTLELPDKAAREAVLKVHTRKVPLAKDVDLGEIAAGTPGFSGADLKNLVNEAAMAAAREEVGQVTMRHLDEMRDKVMMGSVRTLAIHPEERHRLAVHEAGHTAVAHYLSYADPLYKVTIIPRGRTLGGTHMLPDKERHTLPEPYLKDQLAVILGGRTAERELLGSASSGADDDIQRATQMARAMVARWGMSDAIGPVDLRQSEEHPFLGREIAQPRRFSETTAHEVDKAVAELLQGAEERASETIRQNKPRIEKLITALEAKETLNRDEIASYLGPNRSHIGSLTMLTPRA